MYAKTDKSNLIPSMKSHTEKFGRFVKLDNTNANLEEE